MRNVAPLGLWVRFLTPEPGICIPGYTIVVASATSELAIGAVRYPRLVPKDEDCAKHLAKRTLTNLYNTRPTWLEFAHRKLDSAVAAAYWWPGDVSDEEIPARVLALNLERASSTE